jgi:hypothetical protein
VQGLIAHFVWGVSVACTLRIPRRLMYDVWLQVTIRSIEHPAVRSVRERFGPLQAAALLRLKPNRSGSLTARLNGLKNATKEKKLSRGAKRSRSNRDTPRPKPWPPKEKKGKSFSVTCEAVARRFATGRALARVLPGTCLEDQGESGRRFRTGRLSGWAAGVWVEVGPVPPGTAAETAPSE